MEDHRKPGWLVGLWAELTSAFEHLVKYWCTCLWQAKANPKPVWCLTLLARLTKAATAAEMSVCEHAQAGPPLFLASLRDDPRLIAADEVGGHNPRVWNRWGSAEACSWECME